MELLVGICWHMTLARPIYDLWQKEQRVSELFLAGPNALLLAKIRVCELHLLMTKPLAELPE